VYLSENCDIDDSDNEESEEDEDEEYSVWLINL
jgi:hypothetical protein